ncbi:hypothetical protein [Advenella sp. S44]|uniref:hypothetical protein n=1 Tax=Advenella sp. S44 TaxID=1982755 RepID=UPI0018D554D7|nr:hypothetical protein [Advenella sp. S44]
MKVLKSLLLFFLLMLAVGYTGSQLLLYKQAPEYNQQAIDAAEFFTTRSVLILPEK